MRQLILKKDAFYEFQQQGWQRIADKYDVAWSGLVKPFARPLLKAAKVKSGTRLLDLACGPGYISEAAKALGAIPTGLDFSSQMICIARKHNPMLLFHEGDAQDLEFEDDFFDSVVMNFGLLHLSRPQDAIAQACRVVRPGGWFGFTVWATPDKSPGNRIVTEAINDCANIDIPLPKGPDYFAYANQKECRNALGEAGFDPESFIFQSVTIEWKVPSVSFIFESERDAGVRTAAILAAQKPEALAAIKAHIEKSVRTYKRDKGFAIPFTAHIIAARAL